MRDFRFLLFFLCVFGVNLSALAQETENPAPQKCATNKRLEKLFQGNPVLRNRFQQEQRALTLQADQRKSSRLLRTEAVLTIPVVFHVLLADPSVVTNAQVQAQLDTLNKSFSGTNGDAGRVPDYFKPFFGNSTIQFCLAQRTPAGEETTGVERKSTSVTSFSTNDAMKRSSSGGVNSWNTDAYLNIWICSLSDNVLGYATFPNVGEASDQGVVIDYRSLPGGSSTRYNGGKTLVHEIGHYFNLHHIWGDDNGLCSGTDFVDDTPNQGDATNGCFSGVRTDNCSATGNGIMYQNYMDYSYDQCLVMFTKGQALRMETSLALNRSSLLQSNGCQPLLRKAFDAQVRVINSPGQRLCSPSFTPVISLRNRGSQTLTAVTLQARIDNGPVSTTTWTGSLAPLADASVTLNTLTATAGIHLLTVYSSGPNGRPDEEQSNDTLRMYFQYYPPVTSINESFESMAFPPIGWDIVNSDNSYTWRRQTSASKTGIASVMINNQDYSTIGEIDDLRLPQFTLPATLDSAFFSFEVAAATYTEIGTLNTSWDTLEVLISTDCGLSYTSLYKKWGASLVTRKTPVTEAFVPTASEWRKDSINLSQYIGQNNLLLTFRNTTGYENNIYLDDINLRTLTVNPNLKAKGFLVTPNPASGRLSVQFYPQPDGLQAVQLFSVSGQKLAEYWTSDGQPNNLYNFDLSRYAAGTYFVRAVFTDRVVVEKILKL